MTKFSLPSSIRIIDIVQILLIAIFVYYLMVWIKNTRAYTLLKGVLIVSVFLIIAAILRMDTILWICQQLLQCTAKLRLENDQHAGDRNHTQLLTDP